MVVSYWNSTSNHNQYGKWGTMKMVVSYWNSTSNHNGASASSAASQLYLIEILHQTTTLGRRARHEPQLYLIEILHQTTTYSAWSEQKSALYLIEILHQTTTPPTVPCFPSRCILLKFYIKPQHTPRRCCFNKVVSYWNSTSNHNSGSGLPPTSPSCILLKFYIKPQRSGV